MTALKRALLYILRKKHRTVLLLSILCICIVMFTVCFSVYQGAESEKIKLMSSVASGFNIEIAVNEADESLWETHYFEGGSAKEYIGPQIDDKMIEDVAGLGGVAGYNISQSIIIHSDLDVHPGLFADEIALNESDPDEYPLFGEEHVYKNSLLLRANSNSESDHFFKIGAFSIIEGRHIANEKNTVIVSDYIAEKNNIKIGDKINLDLVEIQQVLGGSTDKIICGPYELEVVGIFHINFDYEPSEFTVESEFAENYIFTGIRQYMDIKSDLYNYLGKGDAATYGVVEFFVDDPLNTDKIIETAKIQLGAEAQYFNFVVSDSNYKAVMEPLESLSSLMFFIMAVSLCAGVAILAVIFITHIKSRKKEIGIYMALGINKKNVSSQIFFESLIILLIAFIISFSVAAAVLPSVDSNINTTFAESESGEFDVSFNGFDVEVYKNKEADIAIDSAISFENILFILLIIAGPVECSLALILLIFFKKNNINSLLKGHG